MDLCVFQGTFNPIHNAHIRVGQFVLTNYAMDGIIFIPAYMPPHKDFDPKLSIHRLKMTQLAVKPYPKFTVSDIEYNMAGKSYTYYTICELKEKYKLHNRIKFIIGTDAFRNIESWFETDKLKELVDFLVLPRENNFDERELFYLKRLGYRYKVLPLDYNDISSTLIREKIRFGKSISELVPKAVEDYIIENDLYRS